MHLAHLPSLLCFSPFLAPLFVPIAPISANTQSYAAKFSAVVTMAHTCTEPSVRGAHGEQGWVTTSISGVSVPSEYPHRSHKKPKGSCLVFYKAGSLPPYCPVRARTASERVRHSIPARFRYEVRGLRAQVVPVRTGSFNTQMCVQRKTAQINID